METPEVLPHNAIQFPPVVTVLGHVDHGKTTLLDKIRKTDIAGGEKGGITQGIGASQIEILHEGKKRKITFIDTPGHEIFSNMRREGVAAADIALLVIAADDGIMPQTKESIQKILKAHLPYIIVITKIDLENARIEKVKQQLLAEKIILEEYGGNVPFIGVSAKTGEKIKELLDFILLVYDVSSIQKNERQDFLGVAIESKVDKKKGGLSSIIVKSGTLSEGDKLFTEEKEIGKARALLDTKLLRMKQVRPGDAVEVLGLQEVIPAGTLLYTSLPKREIAKVTPTVMSKSLPHDLSFLLNAKNKHSLRLILKTQSQGEIEAIKQSLPEDVELVFGGQGDISMSDILLAKDFDAIILGFRVSIAPEAKRLAESEHILYRMYGIVYELLDELEDVLEYKTQQSQETILGKGQIIAEFPTRTGKIMGVKINEGRLALNDKTRIMRGDKIVGTTTISSLKRGKAEVKEIGKNLECGVVTSPQVDFSIKDMILSYR